MIRLSIAEGEDWDVTVERRRARLGARAAEMPTPCSTADAATWERLADDVASGMDAFRAGRLRVRRNLHLGVGFLAATAPDVPGRLRFTRVAHRGGSSRCSRPAPGPRS